MEGRTWRAAIAVCSLLALAAPAHGGGLAARSSLDFKVVIPAMVRVKLLSAPTQLSISRHDLARGFVDADATSVLVTSNGKAGYTMSIAFDPRLVSRIEVSVPGRRVHLSQSAGSMHVDSPRVADVLLQIEYRLHLNSHATAGMHPWPVALDFAPNAA